MPLLIIRLYWLVVKYLDHHFRQLLIDFLRVIMGELAGGEKEKKIIPVRDVPGGVGLLC